MTKLQTTRDKIADALSHIEREIHTRSVAMVRTKLDEALMWADKALREERRERPATPPQEQGEGA